MSFLRVITVPAEGNLNSRQSLSKSILRKKLRVAVMVDRFAVSVDQTYGMEWNERREKQFTRGKRERRNKVI